MKHIISYYNKKGEQCSLSVFMSSQQADEMPDKGRYIYEGKVVNRWEFWK